VSYDHTISGEGKAGVVVISGGEGTRKRLRERRELAEGISPDREVGEEIKRRLTKKGPKNY